MGVIAFVMNPFRYVLGNTLSAVFAEDVRNNPVVVNADVQSDDVGGSRRSPRETQTGFKPQYVVKLRQPRSNVEAQRLYNHVRTLAFYLDAIPFLGRRLPFNVGIDSIVGLIPGLGDLAGLLLSLYAFVLCLLFGLPIPLIGMMLFNILLDSTMGLIPIVGDALDVAFKANLRNLRLLEDHLIKNDGKCGAGTFTIHIPPSDQFIPKGAPPSLSRSAEGPRRSARVAAADSLLPDGSEKKSWTTTGGSDFRNGATGKQRRVHGDEREATMTATQDRRLASCSQPAVPKEIFTTMRYEESGVTLAEMCRPLVEAMREGEEVEWSPSLSVEINDRHEIPLWSRHMKRLAHAVDAMRAAGTAHWSRCTFDEAHVAGVVREHVDAIIKGSEARGHRLRVAVTSDGMAHVASAALPPSNQQAVLSVRSDPSPLRVRHFSKLDIAALQHKTSNRAAYDQARERVNATLGAPASQGTMTPCFDALLNAEQDDGVVVLTESSIANIIVLVKEGDESKRRWTAITPPANDDAAPLLPGLMRNYLLDTGLLHERKISLDEARQLTRSGDARIFLCNALRGIIPVEWID